MLERWQYIGLSISAWLGRLSGGHLPVFGLPQWKPTRLWSGQIVHATSQTHLQYLAVEARSQLGHKKVTHLLLECNFLEATQRLKVQCDRGHLRWKDLAMSSKMSRLCAMGISTALEMVPGRSTWSAWCARHLGTPRRLGLTSGSFSAPSPRIFKLLGLTCIRSESMALSKLAF